MSWEIKKFVDVIEDVTGGNHKFQTNDYLPEGKLAIVDQGKNLIAGYVNQIDKKIRTATPVIIFGDHTRVLKYIDFPFALGADGVKILKPKIEVNTKFLFYHFHVLHIPETGYNRHFKYLKESELNIPSLSTQKKIVAILDQADELRKKDQQLLAQYDALLQSIFYDMFGDPVVNEKGWSPSTLKELFQSNPRLGTITPVTEQGLLPVVRVGELGELDVAIEKCKKVVLSQNEKERYLLRKNDILLARAIGSLHHLGKASMITKTNEEIVFDSHVMRLQFNQTKMSSLFFYNWLQSNGGRKIFLNNSGKTSVQFNINGEQISKIKIPLPPLNLQKKFATIAQNIEKQKQQIKQQLQQSEALFQTLLRKTFSAELIKE